MRHIYKRNILSCESFGLVFLVCPGILWLVMDVNLDQDLSMNGK